MAAGIAIMTVLASGTATATTAGVVAGLGTATFPGCPPGSDLVIPIVGVNVAGTWTFVAGDFNLIPPGNLACNIVSVGDFSGTKAVYTVATGGCLGPGPLGLGITLCLGGFTVPGPATVSLFMCQTLAGCVTGTATLVGADV